MRRLKLTTLFILTFLAGQSQTKNFLDQPYLEVAGNADTLLTPNEIYIKIIITEKDTRDRISVEDQELKMYNALKSLGIDVEKNLTTSDMSSNFKFYLLRSKDVMKSKQYILRVSDAVTVSKVFIELENLGISNTSIERVDHSDLESIRNLLRSKAVENARTRAIALTEPLKQTVGPAIHIADNEVYSNSNQLRGRLDEVVVVAYGIKKNSGAELPKIEFEKIKVASNINVKFMLK
ncbi:SIMPL domain-containing protein [Flavihumibacter sp.]|uniref:SIMPL domain-containing protein n=1 Tax=Flavihumibacter sp. TaxID=1913981 RepID=UPI002FCCAD61